MSGPVKLVLLEDDPLQRRFVKEYLAQHGLSPAAFSSDAEFKRAHAQHLNEAEDGFALARWTRADCSRMGNILLTPAGDPADRVAGLESGTDDYGTKPFERRELLARIKPAQRLGIKQRPALGLPFARHLRQDARQCAGYAIQRHRFGQEAIHAGSSAAHWP